MLACDRGPPAPLPSKDSLDVLALQNVLLCPAVICQLLKQPHALQALVAELNAFEVPFGAHQIVPGLGHQIVPGLGQRGSAPRDWLQLSFKGQRWKGVQAILHYPAHGRMPQNAADLRWLHVLHHNSTSTLTHHGVGAGEHSKNAIFRKKCAL